MSRPKIRRRSLSLRSLISFLAASTVAVALLGFMVSGCGSSSAENNPFDAGTGPVTTKTKGPISENVIENLVTRKLGDAGIQGQPVIRSVTLTPEAGGTFVDMELNRTSSCHPGALVGTAVTMAQQVMSAVFLYPDVSRAQLTLYGTTEDAKDKDKQAVRILVTREAAAKIDWFQFSESTVASLSTEFWVEPGVLANFQQYGSAPITDPAKLQAANSGTATTTP